MINKIVHIKNYGRFSNFITNSDTWNGSLEKVNAIYADNGAGKTTLAQIFKSLKGDNELIGKRKTLGCTEDIDIFMITSGNNQLKYQNSEWNHFKTNIEVFDSFYIESNVYLITLGNYDRKGNYFEFIIGEDAIQLFNGIVELRRQRKRLSQARLKHRRGLKFTLDINEIKAINKRVENSLKRTEEINQKISELESQLVTSAESFGRMYLDKINYYLKYFCPDIKLSKLNKKGNNFVYYLKIQNFNVRSDSESISLKHTLSEGDKNSLALSFFLARLSLLSNIDEKIVVFDDPMTSFDASRRSVTINQLNGLSKKTKQFILLSHDLNFVKDFSMKSDNCLNLKIVFRGNTSLIINHDINRETLTGIFKDLTVMHEYLEKGAISDLDKREVIRCIRPSIEGLFRMKYYKEIAANEWLGDILKRIRNSQTGDKFNHLVPLIEELSDINDYSKTYHHSNPNYLEVPINDAELRNYTQRTLDILIKI